MADVTMVKALNFCTAVTSATKRPPGVLAANQPGRAQSCLRQARKAMLESGKATSAEVICPIVAATRHMGRLQQHVTRVRPSSHQLQEKLQGPQRAETTLWPSCQCRKAWRRSNVHLRGELGQRFKTSHVAGLVRQGHTDRTSLRAFAGRRLHCHCNLPRPGQFQQGFKHTIVEVVAFIVVVKVERWQGRVSRTLLGAMSGELESWSLLQAYRDMQGKKNIRPKQTRHALFYLSVA